MNNYEYLDSVLADAGEVTEKAEAFRNSTVEAFNYRPGGEWSAADCLTHLLLINSRYIPIFNDLLKNNTESGNVSFSHSFMGKYIIRAVHPDTPRKVKTMTPYVPDNSTRDLGIIDKFLNQHKELSGYFDDFRNYNIKKIKITSPLSKLVRYNIGDAFRIIIYHDLRHLKQGERSISEYTGK